jgi:hypothetical protein
MRFPCRLRGEVDFRAQRRKSGEGAFPQASSKRIGPLTRIASRSDLSPQAGRGKNCAALALPYSASGTGLFAGGSTPNALAVRQVMEKLPVVATAATRASSPIAARAAA